MAHAQAFPRLRAGYTGEFRPPYNLHPVGEEVKFKIIYHSNLLYDRLDVYNILYILFFVNKKNNIFLFFLFSCLTLSSSTRRDTVSQLRYFIIRIYYIAFSLSILFFKKIKKFFYLKYFFCSSGFF